MTNQVVPDLESQKLDLERQKVKLTEQQLDLEKYKSRLIAISIVLPVLGTLLTFGIAIRITTSQKDTELNALQTKLDHEAQDRDINSKIEFLKASRPTPRKPISIC